MPRGTLSKEEKELIDQIHTLRERLRPPNGEDIADAQIFLGLTQTGLAKALGTSQGTVSDWLGERQTPRTEYLEALRELIRKEGQRRLRAIQYGGNNP